MTAAEMATELRLIYIERRYSITRLKDPAEAVRRSRRLPLLAAIGKFVMDHGSEIDIILAKGK